MGCIDKDGLIGASPAFLAALAQADRMAGSEARVLLTGETGTGKEVFARRLHQSGTRRDKPFIAINCSALPSALLESELFGHVKGAFSEAHRTHEGLIAAAGGGTLFFDEIAEMELPLQAKLLRFIETGEFRKVGSTDLEKTDVRIISATHRNLKQLVACNMFREDLYYRLSVLTLELPHLRARKEDIPLLALHFLQKFSTAEGKNFSEIAPEALFLLMHYGWPGNIRELQNMLHKITVLHDGPVLTAEMLRGALPTRAEGGGNVMPLKVEGVQPKPLWEVEKEAIDSAISYCGGNIHRAAALLQLSPSTLYRRRDNPADISSA